MQVKRLHRPTVREALTAAREELGPGAIVMSTELVPAPGWRGWMGRRVVQLTAAADMPQVSDDRPVKPTPRQRGTDVLRSGVIARLTAAGLDKSLAEAVAGRMSPAECRGASDVALRKALAAELESLSGGDTSYEKF